MKDGSFITCMFIVFMVAVASMTIYDIIMSKQRLEELVIEQQQTIEQQDLAIEQLQLLIRITQQPLKYN